VSSAWRRLGTCAALALLVAVPGRLAAAGAAAPGSPPGPPPAPQPAAAAVGPGREYFTDLKLVGQDGREFRFFSDLLAGRVVLISGFYTNCTTVSPRQNLVLSRLQKILGERLGKEAFIVSITVDPQRDTPEKVREYAGAFRAGPGWLFLTGKPENVNWVNYRLGQYLEDPEKHLGVYIIGNLRTGLWVKASPAAGVEDLLRQLETAIADAPAAKP
jgi:protein SCO1/2